MAWSRSGVRWVQAMVAVPQTLALLLVVDLAAYFAGLLFWYGYVMADPATPWWAWAFIPDCPLFGLLGGIGLLMVTAQRDRPADMVASGQRTLAVVAAVSTVVWATTLLPIASPGWAAQGAMFAVLSGSLVVGAVWFRRPPGWLLGIFAFGQIKYGIWTITAWILDRRSTAIYFGAPNFSLESIFMTVMHVGLFAQGVLLLTYFRPTWRAAVAALVWFGLSDFMDYGLGFFPEIPQLLISLSFMQWSTMTVTAVMTVVYLVWGGVRSAPAAQATPHTPQAV